MGLEVKSELVWIDNICIVKSSTGRVLLYYAEDYIKKGTPKVFRRFEIVENILRLRVRITKSLGNITKSQCGHSENIAE